MDIKLVSIGLATMNGAPTLRRALDSLLAQTYKNFELLISDNASTDETADICREYTARDPRVRYFRQKSNIGAVNNYLFLLNKAQGQYFMWATDDDWYGKRFIEKTAGMLEKYPQCGVAMSSFERRFPDGRTHDRVIFEGDLDLTGRSNLYIFRKMIYGFPIHVYFYGLFRREFLLRLVARGFPRCIRPDRVFMSEVALATNFASVAELLYYKTRHGELPALRMIYDARYAPDRIQAAFRDPLSQTKYLTSLLSWPLSSSLIPLSSKLLVPLFWTRIAWRKKRTALAEIYVLLSRRETASSD